MDLVVLRLGIEEHHIGLQPRSIKNAGGQAKQRVHIAGFQQLAANLLASTSLEPQIVRQQHGSLARDLQHRDDVLQEV